MVGPHPGKVRRWWETYARCCKDGTCACDGLIRVNVHETGVRGGREGAEREPEVESGRIPRKEVEETAGAPEMGPSEMQGGGVPPTGPPLRVGRQDFPPTESRAHGFILYLPKCILKIFFFLYLLTPHNLLLIYLHHMANSLRTKICVLLAQPATCSGTRAVQCMNSKQASTAPPEPEQRKLPENPRTRERLGEKADLKAVSSPLPPSPPPA